MDELEPISTNEAEPRYNYQSIVVIVAAVLVVIGLVVGAYAIGYNVGTKNINSIIETTAPETEATETVEETTAPVETSIPTTEEIIPETTEVIKTEPATETTEPIPEPTSAPVKPVTKPSVNKTDLELLACVIYQEAGGDAQCDECRRRVADVVLNRVECEHFPDTIHGVLTAKSQYGRYHWTGVVWPKRANKVTEKAAVERAYRIAEEVLNGNHSELYGNDYVWQAGFKQGRDHVYCCGIYFGKLA